MLVGFIGWCLAAIATPAFAFILLLLFFSTEQILQSTADFLRSSSFGMQFTNYVVGITVLFSATLALARRPDLLRGCFSTGQLAVWALYLWMVFSCMWSPGAADGWRSIAEQWPYFVLMFLIAPCSIGDLKDLALIWRGGLVIVIVQACIMLLSPEFVIVGGRLGVAMGSWATGGRSNPLVIGEVGGVCIILGALAGSGGGSRWTLATRVGAVALGSALAVLSGSRGQFILALVALVVGLPLTRPKLDTGRYVSGMVAALVFLPIILWVASIVLDSGGADMAKRWSSESSGSGTEVRSENALFLLQAYLTSPAYWLQGLGYYAFSAINPYGQPYSHVLFADLIGEEGLVGAAIFLLIVQQSVRSGRQLWRDSEDSATDRRAVATLITMIIYLALLSNKQGNLSGSFVLFGLVILMCRLRERQLKD